MCQEYLPALSRFPGKCEHHNPSSCRKVTSIAQRRFWFSWVKHVSQAPLLMGCCWHRQEQQPLLRALMGFFLSWRSFRAGGREMGNFGP